MVLVAHGSPDPEWRRPLEQLQGMLVERLGERVALAYLAHPPSILDVIQGFADAGYRRVIIVAALLSPSGKHVKHDIPEAVEQARARWPELDIALAPGTLGEDPRVIGAMAAVAIDHID